MRLGERDDRADQAGRQWDAFVNGSRFFPSEPTADFSTTISRLHAGDDAPAVDPAFSEQLLARLITGTMAEPNNALSTVHPQEGISMEQTIDNLRPTRVRRRAQNFGRQPAQAPTRRAPGADPRRGIRPWVELPAMLAVLAVLIGTIFVGRGPSLFQPDDDNAVIPAAATPTGIAAPDAQPAVPVLMGQSRGNAARTGVYPGAGPVTAPEIVWQKEMPGARINPLIVVDNGRIFLLKSPVEEGGPPQLWAFDLRTGDVLWTFSVGWTNNSMLAAANGWVYISRTDDGAGEQPERLIALDAETGEEQWSYPIGVAQRSTLAIADGTVFAVGGDQTLHAIDAVTGAARWTFELTGKPSANPGFSWELESPAVAGGTVYAPAIGGVLYAIDAETGAERWRVETGSDNLATPAVDDGVVYLNAVARDDSGATAGWAYALDAAKGTERWRADAGALQSVNAPVVGDDLIVVSGGRDDSVAQIDDESVMSAYDRATGELRWSITSVDSILDPVLANGVLYAGFGEDDGELHAYDATSGDLLWSAFTGVLETEPVVVDGMIVLSTYNGKLLVLGSSESESTPAATAVSDVSGLPSCNPTRPNVTALPVGTPAASLAETQSRTRGGLEIKVEDLPEGDPADAEVVTAVEEVLGRIADCELRNATSPIIPSGFFTDDFYRRITLEGRVLDEGFGSSLAPLLGGNGSSARSVSEVRELEDGRYAATVMTSETTGYLLIFIEQDGLWLIDEYATIVEIFDQQG